jgi:hypothetical protein
MTRIAALLSLILLAWLVTRRRPEVVGRWVEPDDGWGLFT